MSPNVEDTHTQKKCVIFCGFQRVALRVATGGGAAWTRYVGAECGALQLYSEDGGIKPICATTSVYWKIATRVHSTKERPEVSSRGVVVEYIDRAHRATLEIFAQHLPLTLHNAAKLGHFSMGSNGRWSTSEHKRTSNG